jgi:hypothetical protein
MVIRLKERPVFIVGYERSGTTLRTCRKYSKSSHARHRHGPDRHCRYGRDGHFRKIPDNKSSSTMAGPVIKSRISLAQVSGLT